MKKLLILIASVISLGIPSAMAQCQLENKAFNAGERLDYQLYFNWQFIWIKAGTASLEISETTYKGQPAYHASLITRGSKRTDKFFMMRDTLSSYVTPQLVPLYYRKGALEGKRFYIDEACYSYPGGKTHVTQHYINDEGKERHNEYDGTDCITDMVSMLLRARSFDPSSYRDGQRLKFFMADGCKIKEGTLVFRGRKKFKMDSTGVTYRCLVFSFIDDRGKKEKEVITFYITDDMNHTPVRLDMYLRFGTAKAFLSKQSGLRNPQTSIVR